MSKFVANEIKRSGKDIIFTTSVSEYHIQRFLNELKDIDKFEVTVKKHKESRSARQNAMLWAIMEKISLEVNFSKREEDVLSVYQDILKQANIKHIILDVPVGARNILEESFRVVVKLPGSEHDDKGVSKVLYKCYVGSSKFDTKEMTDLIDCALDYAHQVGVYDSEIMSIKETYKL